MNQTDTIKLLEIIHKLHKHKKIAIFFDNSSIHNGKRAREWMDS